MAAVSKTTSFPELPKNDAVLPSDTDHPTLPTTGIRSWAKVGNKHPLDPLSEAEISVAVATVRASGETPEVRDGIRFIEVSLVEPEKQVVALADAYFFPPFQSSLVPRTKSGPLVPSKLPSRRARLIVYNKRTNETSIWVVELSEVHAVARGGHHKGKVVSSQVIPEVQPAMVAYVKRATQQNEDQFELLEICWRSS